MSENKVKFDLRNVHYAPLTYNESKKTWEFQTPVPFPGAVSLSITARGELTPFYADGIVYWCGNPKTGFDGDLEVARVLESFEKDCLGVTADSKGLLYETSGDKVSPFALLFEFDGDAKAQRHCLYHCHASRKEESSQTKEDKVTPVTDKLTILSTPSPYFSAPNGMPLIKGKTGSTADETLYNSWYDKVPMPTEAAG